MAGPKKSRARRRERRIIPSGRAYIQSSFNNTIVTLTDPEGNVLAWGSSGTAGFKGSRKGYSVCRSACCPGCCQESARTTDSVR